MNFSSIKEYFYKVYSYSFIIMLLPLSLLGIIHYQALYLTDQLMPIDISQEFMLYIFLLLIILTLTIVHLYSISRLKKIIKMAGLGNKMDHYFYLTMTRLAVGAFICFTITAAYVLTQNEWLDILFFLILGWMFFQLPNSGKVCKELKLRGDEHEMIYFKKDRF